MLSTLPRGSRILLSPWEVGTIQYDYLHFKDKRDEAQRNEWVWVTLWFTDGESEHRMTRQVLEQRSEAGPGTQFPIHTFPLPLTAGETAACLPGGPERSAPDSTAHADSKLKGRKKPPRSPGCQTVVAKQPLMI